MDELRNGAVTELVEENQQAADAGSQQTSSNTVRLDEILTQAQSQTDAGNPDADAADNGAETVEDAGDDGQSGEQTDAQTTDQTSKVYRTQAEFDAAFSKRMRKEREQNRPLVEMGRAVSEVAGEDLTPEEVRDAIASALADKRAKANKTDFDTEMNNIRVEQRVAERFRAKPTTETQPDANVEARTQEMVRAMEAIGDDGFNPEALSQNQEALRAWVEGATPAQIYRQFFTGGNPQPRTNKPKRPAPERAANSGAMGRTSQRLTAEQIRRIDEEIAKGNEVSVI